MHAWEGRPFDDIAGLCGRRDPRRYPFAYVAARPGHGGSEVLQWFRHPGELAAFLWRMEPQRWGIRLGELAAFKARTEPVVVELDVVGLEESLREAYNTISRPAFELRWWGDIDQLRAGVGDCAQQALREFRAGTPHPVEPEELEAFIGHLRDRRR